jgi:methyltransferase (TIGR00027 family)
MINDRFPTPTSLLVAASRAMGARDPDLAVRNPDFLARSLLGSTCTIGVDHPVIGALDLDYGEAMQKPEVSGIVRRLMVRTRFIDEALIRAVSNGVSRIAIIGSGLDSRAQRFRNVLEHIAVFEVDHPDALAFKRQRLRQTLGTSDGVEFVPFDYRRDSLSEALRSSGWPQSGNALFIWEGNTMYLSEGVVQGTLEFVARHAAGSTIVFDYVTSSAIAAMSSSSIFFPARGAQQEPWTFGLPNGREREYLDAFGLEIREILEMESPAAVKRFLTRSDGSTVGARLSVWFPYFLIEAVVR